MQCSLITTMARKIGKLKEREQIKQLATLYITAIDHHFSTLTILKFLRCYFTEPFAKIFASPPKILQKVEKRVQKIYHYLYTKRRVVHQKTWDKLVICDRKYHSPTMQLLLDNPDKYIEQGELLKGDGTSTVAKVNLDGAQIVIKRFNARNNWHKITRSFRPSRAEINWRNAYYFKLYRVLTPTPMAMIEKRFGPMRLNAYYISEYIVGETADKYFTSSAPYLQQKVAALKLCKFLLFLRNRHIRHGDTKATNFIISDHAVYLLDLDAIRHYSRLRYALDNTFINNKRRFMANWENNPETKELFAATFNRLEGSC